MDLTADYYRFDLEVAINVVIILIWLAPIFFSIRFIESRGLPFWWFLISFIPVVGLVSLFLSIWLVPRDPAKKRKPNTVLATVGIVVCLAATSFLNDFLLRESISVIFAPKYDYLFPLWLALIALFAWFLATGIIRMVFRLLPFEAFGKRRWIWGLFFLAAGFYALTDPYLWKHLLDGIQGTDDIELLVANLFLGGIVFAYLGSRYLRGRPKLEKYVLFLRSFLTFSDREVTRLLFKYLLTRIPLLMLTPRNTKSETWDPVTLCFSGNQLLWPRKHFPLYLRSSDERWQEAVTEALYRANAVVIDFTNESPAVRWECEQIFEFSADSKTIWLYNGSLMDAAGAAQRLDVNIPENRLICYTQTWTASIPRLAFLYVFTGFFAGTFCAHPELVSEGSNFFSMLAILLIIVTAFWGTRSIDYGAQRRLRTLLEDVGHQFTDLARFGRTRFPRSNRSRKQKSGPLSGAL